MPFTALELENLARAIPDREDHLTNEFRDYQFDLTAPPSTSSDDQGGRSNLRRLFKLSAYTDGYLFDVMKAQSSCKIAYQEPQRGYMVDLFAKHEKFLREFDDRILELKKVTGCYGITAREALRRAEKIHAGQEWAQKR